MPDQVLDHAAKSGSKTADTTRPPGRPKHRLQRKTGQGYAEVANRIATAPADRYLLPKRAAPQRGMVFIGGATVVVGIVFLVMTLLPQVAESLQPTSMPAPLWPLLIPVGSVLLMWHMPATWFRWIGKAIEIGSTAIASMGTLIIVAWFGFVIVLSTLLMLQQGAAPGAGDNMLGLVVFLWAFAAGFHMIVSTSVTNALLVTARRDGIAVVRLVMWPVHAEAARSALMWVAAAFVGFNLWNRLVDTSDSLPGSAGGVVLPSVVLITIILGVLTWFAGRRHGVERTRRELAESVTAAYVQSVLARESGSANDRWLLAGRLCELEGEFRSTVDGYHACRRGSGELLEVVRYLTCVLLDGEPDREHVPHLSQFPPVDQGALLDQTLDFLASIRAALVGASWSSGRLPASGAAASS